MSKLIEAYAEIGRLTAVLKISNVRERRAFMAGLESAIMYDELGDLDAEQEWQQYRCQDDSDWASVSLGQR